MSQQHVKKAQVAWISPQTHQEALRQDGVRHDDAPVSNGQTAYEEGASPRPPVSRVIGEANGEENVDASPEVEGMQQVTSTEEPAKEHLLHHNDQKAGESADEQKCDPSDDEDDVASASDETDSYDLATAILQPAAIDFDELARQQAVKQDQPATNSKRNTPLTESEEDQFLLCLRYGFSIRQAAAAVGCSHSTMVKRAKRDEAFAKKIKQAQANARIDPLWEITIASRKSWRAAAWLLTYLERRDNRGKSKAS